MISIIIPTRNEEKWLPATLQAIKSKLHRPYEIIVSDGASQDKTVAVAKSFGAKVIEHTAPHKQTIAEGRNMGGTAAHGDILLFLDADCEIQKPNQFYDTVREAFEKDPDLVAIAPILWISPENATLLDTIIFGIINNWFIFANDYLHFGIAPGECQIVRKKAFQELGGYRTDLVAAEDADFFFRLSRKGKARMIRTLAVHHTGRRIHKLGWPKLLSQWALNYFSLVFRGKSATSEWVPVR